jgi:uncharacterized membrane-anchored protein
MSELLDTINDLIAVPSGDLGRIEHTLTDGYAQALRLEAEGRRIERRIAEVTRKIGRGGSAGLLDELAELARRLDANRAEVEHLRGVLRSLRRVADAVRSAA